MMEYSAYDFAEAVAEEIANGTIPDVVEMVPPDGGEAKVSFLAILESGQRFRVTVRDVTGAVDDDED